MSELEPSEVEFRRAARERALELLYEAELKGLALAELVDALPLSPAPLADELVRGVDANRAEIDKVLARRVAPRWSLSRLAAVDRAILRLGSYELMKASDRSQAVIINEGVVLARRFGTDDSARFVNGVLSAVAAEVRPSGGANGRTGETEPVGPPGTTGMAGAEVEGAATAGAPGSGSGVAEPSGRLVDALVIDLDGVIRHWDPEALPAAERDLGLGAGSIAGAAFDADRLDRAMRGSMTFAEWAGEIGQAVGESHEVDAKAVTAAFTDVGWRIDELVMGLVDQARRQVPVALLSNASSRLLEDLRRSDIVDHFDAAIASADIGVVKPEPDAFRAAAERLGVALERCLYVDDNEANIVAARALGMRAVRFQDVDQLEGALAAVGLTVI